MKAAEASVWAKLFAFLTAWWGYHFPKEASDLAPDWEDGEEHYERDEDPRLSAEALQLADVRHQNE